jgi:hypothetical protein
MTFEDSGSGFRINDKIIHFSEYAVLGYLLMKYFRINREKDINRSALLSFFQDLYMQLPTKYIRDLSVTSVREFSAA